MSKDDYVLTLPYLLIMMALACRAAGAPDAVVMPVIMGSFALIQTPGKSPPGAN